MKLTDRLVAAFRVAFNRGLSKPEDPYRFLQYLPVPLMPAGIHLTMDTARELSVVWACMDAITKAIASCPWNVYTFDTGRRRMHLPDDSLDYILNVRPNPDTTAIAFKEAMMYGALSWGNAYAEIVPDNANRIAQMYFLLPDRVTPHRDPETWELVYHYQQPDGARIVLPADRVYHLRGPSVSSLMGDNTVAKMAKTIALAMAMERFASTYFGNNTVIGGVLEYPKTLDDKTYERIRSSWEDRFKGPDKAHKPALLEGGMKWVPFDSNAEKSQLTDGRKFQLEEICRFFGVPLHKVQHIDRATFNNIEHLGIEFVRDALTPWAKRLEQEANFKLFRSRMQVKKFTKLDTAWLSYGDAKTRAEYYKLMREMGAYSANDVLEQEGKNPIGADGDVRIVPLNMQSLEQLNIAEQKAEVELENLKNPPEPVMPQLPPGQKALPPGQEPEEEDEEATEEEDDAEEKANKKPNPDALIRDAVIALFASALERYEKRLRAREADLVSRGLKNGKVQQNIIELREQLREGMLLQETLNAVKLIEKYTKSTNVDASGLVCAAADSVDGGEAPQLAASRLVQLLLTTGSSNAS